MFLILTDLMASILSMRGVLGTTNGDNHCSNNSNRNCKHDRMSNSSSLVNVSAGWREEGEEGEAGDFLLTCITRESLSSLSVSSWTSDVTRRLLIAAAAI